jgi:hypothetical protein
MAVINDVPSLPGLYIVTVDCEEPISVSDVEHCHGGDPGGFDSR